MQIIIYLELWISLTISAELKFLNLNTILLIMEALTNDHIISIFGIIGNIVVIIIVGLITYFSVDRYQKKVEERKNRETFVLELNEISLLILYLSGTHKTTHIDGGNINLKDFREKTRLISSKLSILFHKILIYYELSKDLRSKISEDQDFIFDRITEYIEYIQAKDFEEEFELDNDEFNKKLSYLHVVLHVQKLK